MMLRYTFNREESAARRERAVAQVLAQGMRTGDIAAAGETTIGTGAMGDAVVKAL